MKPLWNEVEQGVKALLKDETPEGQNRTPKYATSDLVAWWNHAQIRLATTKPLVRHQRYKDDGITVPLPQYHYKPRAVVVNGRGINHITLEAAIFNPQLAGYYVNEGNLVLVNVTATDFTYLYEAYYPPIKDENSQVGVPMWAIEACSMYVAMLAMTREAVGDARFRKYASSTDAGNPTHNPFLGVAKWLESRYNAIVSTHIDDDEDYRE